MNTGGEAAEQIVRMSLEGFEVAAKITGAGAKNIAILLYSILKEEQKTKGKARLTNMLRSGKELSEKHRHPAVFHSERRKENQRQGTAFLNAALWKRAEGLYREKRRPQNIHAGSQKIRRSLLRPCRPQE